MTTAIEWTDDTLNPIVAVRTDDGRRGWHCEKISPGCAHCYADAWNRAARFGRGTGLAFTTGNRAHVDIEIDVPLLESIRRWRKPRLVFVCSMTDLFGSFVPFEMVALVLDTFSDPANRAHWFQVLTKRPERIAPFFEWAERNWPLDSHLHRALALFGHLPNVAFGTSVETKTYLGRIDTLRGVPAAVRFLSAEPLVGPLSRFPLDGIDQVIVGGESGPQARPMHPDWVRQIRDACIDAGVAFFFKQWGTFWPANQGCGSHLRCGGWLERRTDYVPNDGSRRVDDRDLDVATVYRVGKKTAGRILDGREWNEFPAAFERGTA